MRLALSSRREGLLTGSCFSRQMLNVLVWLGFSFFRGTLVSPMNSLWRNLSSSHTEILEGKGTATAQTHRALSASTVGGDWHAVGEEWIRCGCGGPTARGPHPPQGLPNHVFVRDPVVSEGLVPRGVQSVSEGFCSELIRLEKAKSCE